MKLEMLASGSLSYRQWSREALDQGFSRSFSKNRHADTKGTSTPLSVQSVSVPPYPATPQMPSPSQLPWLQLSGSQFSLPSARALRACALDGCEQPVSTQSSARQRSTSTTALPPLPGAVGDNIGMPHTLRSLARSSRVGIRHADHPDHGSQTGQGAVQPQRLATTTECPTEACSWSWKGAEDSPNVNSWRMPRERKDSLPCMPESQSPPRKRSRLRRVLSCFGRLSV